MGTMGGRGSACQYAGAHSDLEFGPKVTGPRLSSLAKTEHETRPGDTHAPIGVCPGLLPPIELSALAAKKPRIDSSTFVRVGTGPCSRIRREGRRPLQKVEGPVEIGDVRPLLRPSTPRRLRKMHRRFFTHAHGAACGGCDGRLAVTTQLAPAAASRLILPTLRDEREH